MENVIDVKKIDEEVIQVLRNCYDPEIPVNIYELGLIYDIDINPEAVVTVTMTLTSPMCPVAESLPPDVANKIKKIPQVKDAKVTVVWDPVWNKDMMTDAAKLQLGLL